MGLFSSFGRKKRDKSPKLPSNAEMEVRFQKWFDTVGIAEIRSLFLENLLGGHEATSGLLNEGEREHFDKIATELETTPEGHINSTSVVDRLMQAHGEKARIIDAARAFLEALVLSHAHFPFTEPVPLTKETLLQAVVLLTWQCDSYFKQSTGINSNDTIRTRPEKLRLKFMYSALVHPPTGLPTRHDILDVLCRVNYPMGHWAKPKGEPMRKVVSDLAPLASRLQPEEDAPTPEPLSVASLQPLADLVAVFPSRWEEPISDVTFGDREVVSVDQFVRWAKRVRFLDVIHQVFEVFLLNRQHQFPNSKPVKP